MELTLIQGIKFNCSYVCENSEMAISDYINNLYKILRGFNPRGPNLRFQVKEPQAWKIDLKIHVLVIS